jgi:hypothetical protein
VNDNNELKNYLQNGFKNVQLSTKSKDKLHQIMLKELSLGRESSWKKTLKEFEKFLETTYEINLAPLGIALGVLILLINISLASILPDTSSQNKSGPYTTYVQQTTVGPDGRLTIQFIPVYKEDRS